MENKVNPEKKRKLAKPPILELHKPLKQKQKQKRDIRKDFLKMKSYKPRNMVYNKH